MNNGNIMSYIKDAGQKYILSNYIGIMDAILHGTFVTCNPLVVTPSRNLIGEIGLFK